MFWRRASSLEPNLQCDRAACINSNRLMMRSHGVCSLLQGDTCYAESSHYQRTFQLVAGCQSSEPASRVWEKLHQTWRQQVHEGQHLSYCCLSRLLFRGPTGEGPTVNPSADQPPHPETETATSLSMSMYWLPFICAGKQPVNALSHYYKGNLHLQSNFNQTSGNRTSGLYMSNRSEVDH